MPKTHVDKSILIEKSPEEIFEKLSDFHNWIPWSPWLIVEPGVKVTTHEDGKYYEWDGDLVGAGNMTVLSENAPEHLHCNLTFLKPWKSKATVDFYLKPEGNGTRVHWVMDSSLPFFMFFFKKMMEAFIGMDFDRGLGMLKDYMESGEVHSKLNFEGIRDYEGCQYVGIKVDCAMSDIGPSMGTNFEKLEKYFAEGHEDLKGGFAFSIYHKWQPVKGRVIYTAAIPVSSIPSDLPAGMISGKVPATKNHVVKHTGPYNHVGNAWSAQMSRERAKKFKKNRSVHPMEVYMNDPSNTPANELVSEIWVAVK